MNNLRTHPGSHRYSTMKGSAMKNLVVIFFLLLFTGHSFAQLSKKPAGKPGVWKGELVDLYCYAGFSGKGPAHKDCAKICLDSGLPAGLATEDGQLYLLTDTPHHHNNISKKMANLAAQQILVTGTQVEVGGMMVIWVESFEKAPE